MSKVDGIEIKGFDDVMVQERGVIGEGHLSTCSSSYLSTGGEGRQAGVELVGVPRELAALANDLDLDLVATQRSVLRQVDIQEAGLGVDIGSKDTYDLLGLHGNQEDVNTGTTGGLEGLRD